MHRRLYFYLYDNFSHGWTTYNDQTNGVVHPLANKCPSQDIFNFMETVSSRQWGNLRTEKIRPRLGSWGCNCSKRDSNLHVGKRGDVIHKSWLFWRLCELDHCIVNQKRDKFYSRLVRTKNVTLKLFFLEKKSFTKFVVEWITRNVK